MRCEARFHGSFTDLPYLADSVFDAVTCLGGAISHLIDDRLRDAALTEFWRVLRPGGVLVVSFGNRLSGLRGAVNWPDSWVQSMAAVRNSGSAPLPNGAPYREYWPEEVAPLLSGAGLVLDRLCGCQGIAARLAYDRLPSRSRCAAGPFGLDGLVELYSSASRSALPLTTRRGCFTLANSGVTSPEWISPTLAVAPAIWMLPCGSVRCERPRSQARIRPPGHRVGGPGS